MNIVNLVDNSFKGVHNMLQIGDLTIYQEHGICRVKDISEKTYSKSTKTYYVLQPINNDHELTFNIPVENYKNLLSKLMNKEEAEKVLQSFHSDGVEWIDKPQKRTNSYTKVLNSGDRMEVAKVANTLLLKKRELEEDDKNFANNDQKLLANIEEILSKEIAIALDTTIEEVKKKVNSIIDNKTKISR